MIVSICITAYNVAPYITQAIEGALMQKTSFPFEIVIGDDASTDNTRSILLSYKEKYPDIIQLVLHDKNIGVARNDISVVGKAKGKYLAWCDGDDYWTDPNKLQKQYEILENNQDVALVHTDWMDFFEEINSLKRVIIRQKEIEKTCWGIKGIELLLLQQTTGCRYSSSMFRKDYFIDALTDKPDLFLLGHVVNDFAVFVAMYERGRFYHISEATTVYRIRKESLSMTQNKEKRYRYSKGYFYLISYICQNYSISSTTKNIAIRRELNELLKYAFFNKHREDAIKMKSKVNEINYFLSPAQKALYWGAINAYVNKMLYPIFNIILER